MRQSSPPFAVADEAYPGAPPGVESHADPRWLQNHYVVREKMLTLGRQYRVFDEAGQLVAFCRQKMFKLKEDIRFFADESQQHELFRLAATKVIDFSGNFEVVDSRTGRRLGVLRRKGWKSLLRDEWHVLDARGQPWAVLKEDSTSLALVRRFLVTFLPYRYHLYPDASETAPALGEIRERFQLIGDTYDLHVDPRVPVDRRVLLGLAVCIDAIEGE